MRKVLVPYVWLALILSVFSLSELRAEFYDFSQEIREGLLNKAKELKEFASRTDLPPSEAFRQILAAAKYEKMRLDKFSSLFVTLEPFDLNAMLKKFLKSPLNARRKTVYEFLVDKDSVKGSQFQADPDLRRALYNSLDDEPDIRLQTMWIMSKIDPVSLGKKDDFYFRAKSILGGSSTNGTMAIATLRGMKDALSPEDPRFGKTAVLALSHPYHHTVDEAVEVLRDVKPTDALIDEAFRVFRSSSSHNVASLIYTWHDHSPLVVRKAYESARTVLSSPIAKVKKHSIEMLSSLADPSSPEYARILFEATQNIDSTVRAQASLLLRDPKLRPPPDVINGIGGLVGNDSVLPPVLADWAVRGNKDAMAELEKRSKLLFYFSNSSYPPKEDRLRAIDLLASVAHKSRGEALSYGLLMSDPEIVQATLNGLYHVDNPAHETIQRAFQAMKSAFSDDGYMQLGLIFTRWGSEQKTENPSIELGLLEVVDKGSLPARRAAADALLEGARHGWWKRDQERAALLAIDADIHVSVQGGSALNHLDLKSLSPDTQVKLVRKALAGDDKYREAKKLAELKDYLDPQIVQKAIEETLDGSRYPWPSLRALIYLSEAHVEIPGGTGTDKIFDVLSSTKGALNFGDLIRLAEMVRRPDIGERVGDSLKTQKLPAVVVTALVNSMLNTSEHDRLISLLGDLKYKSDSGRNMAIDYLIDKVLLSSHPGATDSQDIDLRRLALIAVGKLKPQAKDIEKIARASEIHGDLRQFARMKVGDQHVVKSWKVRNAAKHPRSILSFIYACAMIRPSILKP